MDEELQNNLKQQYDNLPKEVQEAISDVNLDDKLQQVAKNNKILLDQAGALQIETTLVLFGLEPLNDYVDNLVKNVGLPRNQALIVAHDVDELIFKGVREALKKINEDTIAAENKEFAPKEPTKEEILSRIQEPRNIKIKEESISVSSLGSNAPMIEKTPDLVSRGVEVRKEILPEIEAVSVLPKIPSGSVNINASPAQNIVQAKMENPIVIPKKVIVIEEKTKLPSLSATDPYREPII